MEELHIAIYEQREKPKSFLGVKLLPGVKATSLVGYYLVHYFAILCIGSTTGFMLFILEDPDYYNIDKKQLGKELGKISMWGEVLVVMQQAYMGVIVDTFGRKKPILAGLLILGISMALVPCFHDLWP